MKQLTEEQYRIIWDWDNAPIEEREFKTQSALAKYMGLNPAYISIGLRHVRSEVPREMGERKRRLRDKFYRDAMRDDASAKEKEIAGRAHELFIDRVEQIIKIVNADEIARSELEAERRVRENRAELEGRVEGVSEELPLLPEEIREDK